ncbi:MAG: flagellar protein FlgN [Thermodesulfobacteriota bacterium]
MDYSSLEAVEKLFFRKIVLYHDLLEYFRQERESLLHLDLDRLWKIAGEKEELCSEIQALRQEIMGTLHSAPEDKPFDIGRIMQMIPADKRDVFQELYLKLARVKGEIELIRKENMVFIDDSLQFLDEIMSIITGETSSNSIYNDKCHVVKSGSRLLLSKEA